MSDDLDVKSFYRDGDEDERSPEYEAALGYHAAGFNVIPLVHQTKRSAVKYAALHHSHQTRAEVAMMMLLFAGGVAIVTGAISGVIVVDTDGPEGDVVLSEWEVVNGPLPVTLTIRSGSGRGLHRYYKHPGFKVTTKANPSIKLDIKGDGGIVVMPPTLHKSGGRYEVVCDVPIADLPAGLLDFIELKAAEASGKPVAAKGAAKQSALGDNLSWKVPVNQRNVAIIQSMLDALPDTCTNDYAVWFRIGLALHAFCDGRVGLALWQKFSARCSTKAALTDFVEVWSGFSRPYDGREITIGTLWAMAKDYGWKPKPWDMRER
jgi:hypothetical protein